MSMNKKAWLVERRIQNNMKECVKMNSRIFVHFILVLVSTVMIFGGTALVY